MTYVPTCYPGFGLQGEGPQARVLSVYGVSDGPLSAQHLVQHEH